MRRNLRAHTGLPRTDRGKRRWVLTASRELEEVQEASVAQAALSFSQMAWISNNEKELSKVQIQCHMKTISFFF